MQFLAFDDELPARPRRVLVAGTSGSGKTTLADRIARTLQVEAVEIDSLYHGPGWTPRPSFQADVAAFTAGTAWVTEWQYRSVRALLAERADLMVWLDPPTSTVMRQVIARTVRRRWRNEHLWNGNTEFPLRTIFTDPEHIIRWAWMTRNETRARIEELAVTHPELPVVHLRSRAQSEAWLAGPLARTLS